MFRIVTDTSANLPTAYLQQEHITIIPFTFHADGDEQACLDLNTFDAKTFYAQMRSGTKVSTSQIPPQRYLDVLTPMLEAGEDVLFVSMSSGISGSYASGQIAARQLREEFPARKLLLVDTYNTLKSGVPNAIRAFNEVLRPLGIRKCGIRLDSGDMTYLTKKARKMLDEAGWTECEISVSNSLDEYLIQDLLRQGAQIDMFGVGERLITAKSEPVFGGVYKLVAVERPDGTIEPKIKISENVGKITNPHFKKLYRFYGADTGKAIADYLCLHDETVNDGEDLEIFDPEATWKRKKVYNFHARELQVPVFRNGELVYQLPTLNEIRSYCREQVDTLWDEVKRFDNPHTYYVDLSQKLWEIKYRLLKDNACGEHHA